MGQIGEPTEEWAIRRAQELAREVTELIQQRDELVGVCREMRNWLQEGLCGCTVDECLSCKKAKELIAAADEVLSRCKEAGITEQKGE